MPYKLPLSSLKYKINALHLPLQLLLLSKTLFSPIPFHSCICVRERAAHKTLSDISGCHQNKNI